MVSGIVMDGLIGFRIRFIDENLFYGQFEQIFCSLCVMSLKLNRLTPITINLQQIQVPL